MEPLKNYFYYTRSERNGAIALVLLCVMLAVAPRLFPLFTKAGAIDFSEDMALADALPERENSKDGVLYETEGSMLFFFDPNTATQEEFIRLGLAERVAKAIVNYRAKGGQFRKREDLQKIYTLSEADYLRLEPYIRIAGDKPELSAPVSYGEYALFPFDPNVASEKELLALGLPQKVVNVMMRYREKGGRYRRKEDLQKIYILSEEHFRRIEPYITIAAEGERPPAHPNEPGAVETSKFQVVDINKAGAEEWQRLRGIGPAFAGRIVKFREALGGFASVEQVAETWGLPDSTFQHIRKHLQQSPVFRPLPINTVTAEVLAAHPYVDRRVAEAIVAYRHNHGPFRNMDDLRKVYAVKQETLEKLMPYLVFE